MAEIAQTFALNPYAAEAQKLERQRKYAEILQAQGLQPEGKHSYAGIEAPPSAAGALAKGLQLGMSGFMQGRADRKYDDLIGRATAGRKSVMDKVVAALQGAEAVPEVPGSVAATEADVQDREMGMNMGTGAAPMTMGQQIPTQGGMGEGPNVGAPPQAAVPGSMEAANALMIGSEFPDLQAAGLGSMNSMALEAKKLKNAITLKASPGGANADGTAPMQNFAERERLVTQFGEKSPQVKRFDDYVRATNYQSRGDAIIAMDASNPGVPQAVIPKGIPPEQDPDFQRKQAFAKAMGAAEASLQGTQQKKALQALSTLETLDGIEPLIDKSTGSIGGWALDAISSVFGHAPEGAVSSGKLKVLQAGLMLNMPRMEGPQSDRDVNLYREAAGQIGDPTVPNAIKKAAVETIRTIQRRYAAPTGGGGGGGGKRPDSVSEADWNLLTPEEKLLWK